MPLNLTSRLGQVRALLRDRSVVALLLTAAIVGGIFLARHQRKSSLYVDQFWALKASWENCADMVLTGDSRVYIGVSPEAMRQVLPGRTILNYGFSANGYSPEYLRRARAVLREDGSRIIVLGITPRSLSFRCQGNNGYTQVMKDFRLSKGWGAAAGLQTTMYVLAEPLTFENAVSELVHWNNARPSTFDYYADGWMRAHKTRDDFGDSLSVYAAGYENEKERATPAVIDGLLEQVRQWRGEGVRVYAFRVPTSPEMYALENRLSAFNEQSFASKLEQSGGVWIPTDQMIYHSWDGSHLRYDSAIQLSLDLARKIAAAEAARNRQ
jgi:hypothetical protein